MLAILVVGRKGLLEHFHRQHQVRVGYDDELLLGRELVILLESQGDRGLLGRHV